MIGLLRLFRFRLLFVVDKGLAALPMVVVTLTEAFSVEFLVAEFEQAGV